MFDNAQWPNSGLINVQTVAEDHHQSRAQTEKTSCQEKSG